MGFQSPKLSLDLSPPWLHPPPPSTSVESKIREDKSSSELRDYISALEDELRKVEAFQRELPISHLILNDAIAKLKKEESNGRNGRESDSAAAAAARNYNYRESGINLVKSGQDHGDKRSWMSSFQLWSSNISSDQSTPLRPKSWLQERQEEDEEAADQVVEFRINIGHGGSVKRSSSPSNGNTCVPCRKGENASATATNICSLRMAHNGLASVRASLTKEAAVLKSKVQQASSGEGYVHQLRKSPPPRHQDHHREVLQTAGRKQRRCWSPDLQRRFIDALEKLGGSQVATPKQVREVMQVDGLTNDEVKSHLQKYRLHISKLPGTSMSLSTGDHHSDRINVKSRKNIFNREPTYGGSSWKNYFSSFKFHNIVRTRERNLQCGCSNNTGNDQSGSPEGPLHHMSVYRSAKYNSCASNNSLEILITTLCLTEEEEMRDAGSKGYSYEDDDDDDYENSNGSQSQLEGMQQLIKHL